MGAVQEEGNLLCRFVRIIGTLYLCEGYDHPALRAPIQRRGFGASRPWVSERRPRARGRDPFGVLVFGLV